MELRPRLPVGCSPDHGDHRPLRRVVLPRQGRKMKTNRLARHRGVHAATRLGVIIGAVGVAAMAGANAANASSITDSMRGVVVLAEPAAAGDDDAATKAEEDPDEPGGGG